MSASSTNISSNASSTSGTNVALSSLWAGCTYSTCGSNRAGYPGSTNVTLKTSSTNVALSALYALRSYVALSALDALWSYVALDTLDALWSYVALSALWSYVALSALDALWTHRSNGSCNASGTDIAPNTGGTRGALWPRNALWASGTQRTSCSLCSINTIDSRYTSCTSGTSESNIALNTSGTS